MKQIGFLLSMLIAVTAAAAPASLDGKQIFLAQKCNLCHSVSSAGIERTVKSEKVAGPDLTNLAAKEEPAKLIKFLHKEGEINGKKHGKGFTGSDDELTALISWLQQQKK
ncbi:MAG TPA: cytochrome c [Thermoanaerobaculia bacterium]|jgi:cytochrome c5|nr:cytochrome c [Thermoanaerobaculia bacterium]